MRAFTRISIALLLTLFLAVTMSAQTTDQSTAPQSAPPAHKMRGMHNGQGGLDRMAQQLNLTDQQKTQIQGLFQTQRQQAQTIRQDTSLTPEQRQDKLKQLRESTHQQMQGVLTPEQQQKFQQLRSEHEGMGKDHVGRGGMGPMARLNLTPDQKSKIQPILQSSRQQIQAVRADSSLTPEQKRAKVREIHQNERSQVNAVLTPEQQQQLQQMRKGRGGKRGGPPAPPSGL